MLALLVGLGLSASPTPARAAPAGVRPVPGRVLAAFDAPAAPWLPGHRGVDLAAVPGDPVRAVNDGVVGFAGTVVDRGVVSVRLDGPTDRVVTYEPVVAAVSQGDRVRAGEVIGWIGLGGHCSARCLHWGLKIDGEYRNPLTLLTGQIRLLPESARPARLPSAPSPAEPPGGPLLRSGQTITGPGIRPTTGPITSRFGPRLHPVLGVVKLHDGVDLGSPCGDPVRAIWSGTVVSVEHSVAWGLRVVLDHGRVDGELRRTSYNHLSAITVNPGQVVSQGTIVGNVGSTGYSTGCHLHVQLWADQRIVDPLSRLSW